MYNIFILYFLILFLFFSLYFYFITVQPLMRDNIIPQILKHILLYKFLFLFIIYFYLKAMSCISVEKLCTLKSIYFSLNRNYIIVCNLCYMAIIAIILQVSGY